MTKHHTDEEKDYFNRSMAAARKYSLTWEFVHFYKRSRRRGCSIYFATTHALHEWDLWPE